MKSCKISRIFHAGYIVEDDSTKIVFDPIFENPFSINCYSLADIEFDTNKLKSEQFSAVIISHYHDDHFSFESLKLIHLDTPIYMYSIHEEHFELLKKFGFKNVFSLAINETVQINSFQIKVLESLEPDVDSLFHISYFDYHIVNVVDSWLSVNALEYLQKLDHIDVLLWPFQYMREIEILSPERYRLTQSEVITEHIDQISSLKVKTVIPSSCQFRFESWSWLNDFYFLISYQQFIEALKNKKIHCQRLEPSSCLELKKQEQILSLNSVPFVFNKDQYENDYHLNHKVKIEDLSTTRAQFNNLSESDLKKIVYFCEHELIQRLNENKNSHLYFYSEDHLFWILRVVSLEKSFLFVYKFSSANFQISLFSQFEIENQFEKSFYDFIMQQSYFNKICWLTEVMDIKLYSALYGFETLSSTYIRINNMFFTKTIEDTMTSFEVHQLDDLLLKILFNNKIDHYQKFQVQNILNSKKQFDN